MHRDPSPGGAALLGEQPQQGHRGVRLRPAGARLLPGRLRRRGHAPAGREGGGVRLLLHRAPRGALRDLRRDPRAAARSARDAARQHRAMLGIGAVLANLIGTTGAVDGADPARCSCAPNAVARGARRTWSCSSSSWCRTAAGCSRPLGDPAALPRLPEGRAVRVDPALQPPSGCSPARTASCSSCSATRSCKFYREERAAGLAARGGAEARAPAHRRRRERALPARSRADDLCLGQRHRHAGGRGLRAQRRHGGARRRCLSDDAPRPPPAPTALASARSPSSACSPAGIFATMAPALLLLNAHAPEFEVLKSSRCLCVNLAQYVTERST
ncbi:MAG: hypothetical protein MZV64_72390, partial [Ignavibacteriales bacterium]|nr:hypothetical protein [Ignavibacteriales bacterium]